MNNSIQHFEHGFAGSQSEKHDITAFQSFDMEHFLGLIGILMMVLCKLAFTFQLLAPPFSEHE